jgi:cysteine sulfinate desulfinase/cysteine desulfurase-like protein
MSADPNYFDYAATTPADPRVITSMVNCLGIDGVFGNPASNSHAAGFFPCMLAADLAISSTSACSAAPSAVSHVLSAIGLAEHAAARTIRVSLGRFIMERDVDRAITCIRQVVDQCLVVQ